MARSSTSDNCARRAGPCYFPQQATIECQPVSQTVGGLPTDPAAKKPQLGTIGRLGESVCDLWQLRMMLSHYPIAVDLLTTSAKYLLESS